MYVSYMYVFYMFLLLGIIIIIYLTILYIVFYCSKIYLQKYKSYYNKIVIKCLSNLRYFNLEEYKDIFSWMWTYRSLNTYCRMNINKIVDKTILKYIQNDKISLHIFLNKYSFEHSECVYMSRSFNKNEILSTIEKYINNGPLIIKPSHLSFSEGVYIIRNREDTEKIDKLLKIYKNESCSLTEGGNIKDYKCKKGVIIQKLLYSDKYLLNEWKVMYIWGVPIIIHWKLDHTKKYAIMLSDLTIITRKEIRNVCNIPEFWLEMLNEGSRLCKLIGNPFLRVDFLWTESKYIVNECEIIPSNYMLFPFEFMMMQLLKLPYHRESTYFLYESWAYIYYALHFIEYYIRCKVKDGLYSRSDKI